MYIVSFVHKLNRSFLSDKESSALLMSDRFVYRFESHRIRKLIPIFILITYLFIPMLLFYGPTFPVGVMLALSIHFLYGLSGNPHFSFLVVLLYSKFLDLNHIDFYIFVLSMILSVASIVQFTIRRNEWVFAYKALGLFLIFLLNTIIFYIAFLTMNQLPDSPSILIDLTVSQIGVLAATIIFLIINGISPYIFAKSEFCLAMFSNLRIDHNNHLFLKNSKVAKCYAADYCRITRISNLHYARSSKIRVIRHLSYLLDRHETHMYSGYFIRQAENFLTAYGYSDISIHVDSETPLQKNSSNVIFKPYMIPIDKTVGVMG